MVMVHNAEKVTTKPEFKLPEFNLSYDGGFTSLSFDGGGGGGLKVPPYFYF